MQLKCLLNYMQKRRRSNVPIRTRCRKNIYLDGANRKCASRDLNVFKLYANGTTCMHLFRDQNATKLVELKAPLDWGKETIVLLG